jgi:aminopeptidase N
MLTTAAARIILLAGCVACGSCARSTGDAIAPPATDPHSYARQGEVAVTHIALDLNVDVASRRLQGSATLTLVRRSGADSVVLDADGLAISSITLSGGRSAVWYLGPPSAIPGRPLVVRLEDTTGSITIAYATSPDAPALQWLGPEQTAGKRQPFLYTQSQALLARSWIPCQDNPSVRVTYDARVGVPPGLLALMSAQNSPEVRADGIYEFTMPYPIPSYLIALAVGDLAFRPISDRCGVYAERQVVDTAAWEFADVERMMAAAERLYGTYRWGRYDILVLPPAFPFGGMEHPMLTFATPTLLAGDRSLVSTIAHELAHSWSGNLVTNAHWHDFWLNEGFTTYLERRIGEEVYGREFAEMQYMLYGYEVQQTVARLGAVHPDTRLEVDLEGRDPDEALTDVQYEKGALFLRLCEETVGRERWDTFLRSYFDTYAFQPMTTAGFEKFFDDRLLAENPGWKERIDPEAWIHGPGMPPNAPRPHSALLDSVEAAASRWLSGGSTEDLRTGDWSSNAWIYFLRRLPDSLSAARLGELDARFGFTSSGNAELLVVWLGKAIAARYEPARPAVDGFLRHVGRARLLEPLYRALLKTPAGTARARAIYTEARPGYHAITRRILDDLVP